MQLGLMFNSFRSITNAPVQYVNPAKPVAQAPAQAQACTIAPQSYCVDPVDEALQTLGLSDSTNNPERLWKLNGLCIVNKC